MSKNRYLLITSCSKLKKRLNNVPAIELYNGPGFKIIRKYKPSTLDILILSAKYGLINFNEKIDYYEKKMTKSRARELSSKVTSTLLKLLEENTYKEICINVGKTYMLALENWVKNMKDDKKIIIITGSIGKRLKILKEYLIKLDNGADNDLS